MTITELNGGLVDAKRLEYTTRSNILMNLVVLVQKTCTISRMEMREWKRKRQPPSKALIEVCSETKVNRLMVTEARAALMTVEAAIMTLTSIESQQSEQTWA